MRLIFTIYQYRITILHRAKWHESGSIKGKVLWLCSGKLLLALLLWKMDSFSYGFLYPLLLHDLCWGIVEKCNSIHFKCARWLKIYIVEWLLISRCLTHPSLHIINFFCTLVRMFKIHFCLSIPSVLLSIAARPMPLGKKLFHRLPAITSS